MIKHAPKLLLAGLAAAGMSNIAQADSVEALIFSKITTDAAVVFNDTHYSLVGGTGGDLTLVPDNAPIKGYISMESVAKGDSGPTLAQAFFGTDTELADDESIEATISATIESRAVLNGTQTRITLSNVAVSLYLESDQQADFIGNTTTVAQADDLFTNGGAVPDMVFELDGDDDFYYIDYNTTSGLAEAFTFALSLKDGSNTTPWDVIETEIGPGSGVFADVLGIGTWELVPFVGPSLTGAGGPDTFHAGSGGTFSIFLTPSPSAAVMGLVALGGLAARRRRK